VPSTILFVGDSTTEHSFRSLLNLLLRELNETECPARLSVGNDSSGHFFVVPNCEGLRLGLQRNDRLSLRQEEMIDHTNNFYELPWTNLLSTWNVTLLILNRGSHYENDSTVLSQLNDTFRYLEENHPNVSIIWRNTPIGHTDWKSHILGMPLKAIPSLETLTSYHYGEFFRQNELISKYINKFHKDILFLDVYKSAGLRADSRQDPIHGCVPGFMDQWWELLYNALRFIMHFIPRPSK